MSSIGPTLPPYLAKRKRTPDDESDHDSPPSKATRIGPSARPVNHNEIDLDDESDDDFGPSIPATARAPAPRTAGPTLPPSHRSPPPAKRVLGPAPPPTANTHEIDLQDSNSDSSTHGPSAPRVTDPTLPPSASTSKPPPKRVHGPAPPPANLSERPPDPPSDSDSDSDSYGPALPGSASAYLNAAHASQSETPSEPEAPKRDAWMLAPPTSSSRTPDPTRLKARKFASGPRAASSASNAPGEISSIWTETASQKANRLRDQVLGRESGSSAQDERSSEQKVRDRKAEERDARIRAAVDGTRGRSLYEEHQDVRDRGRREAGKGGKAVEEEDDPSKRAFDIEKDMAVGGAISGSQRRELMSKAKDFGGRFQKGSFL